MFVYPLATIARPGLRLQQLHGIHGAQYVQGDQGGLRTYRVGVDAGAVPLFGLAGIVLRFGAGVVILLDLVVFLDFVVFPDVKKALQAQVACPQRRRLRIVIEYQCVGRCRSELIADFLQRVSEQARSMPGVHSP